MAMLTWSFEACWQWAQPIQFTDYYCPTLWRQHLLQIKKFSFSSTCQLEKTPLLEDSFRNGRDCCHNYWRGPGELGEYHEMDFNLHHSYLACKEPVGWNCIVHKKAGFGSCLAWEMFWKRSRWCKLPVLLQLGCISPLYVCPRNTAPLSNCFDACLKVICCARLLDDSLPDMKRLSGVLLLTQVLNIPCLLSPQPSRSPWWYEKQAHLTQFKEALNVHKRWDMCIIFFVGGFYEIFDALLHYVPLEIHCWQRYICQHFESQMYKAIAAISLAKCWPLLASDIHKYLHYSWLQFTWGRAI